MELYNENHPSTDEFFSVCLELMSEDPDEVHAEFIRLHCEARELHQRTGKRINLNLMMRKARETMPEYYGEMARRLRDLLEQRMAA